MQKYVRLIDAAELMQKLLDVTVVRIINGYPSDTEPDCYFHRDYVFSAIANATTINAAPVVRCKDCVCSSLCNDQLICSRIADVTDRYYRGKAEVVMPDDYCSRGIRQLAKMDGGAC